MYIYCLYIKIYFYKKILKLQLDLKLPIVSLSYFLINLVHCQKFHWGLVGIPAK